MIDTTDVIAMIRHWLGTPPNGYFGSSYGNNVAEQLLKNPTTFSADAFLDKLKADIPLLKEVDIDIMVNHLDFERTEVYLQLGRVQILIEKPITTNSEQDFYHATAS